MNRTYSNNKNFYTIMDTQNPPKLKKSTGLWKYFGYLVALLSVFSIISCQKFLHEELQGAYSSASFYQNATEAQEALTATYNDLLFNNTDNMIWAFGDVASDDAVKGSLTGDIQDIQSINQFSVLPANTITTNIWTRYYDCITRANTVLYYVPGIAMDATQKAIILGEAKFIRAYMYFNLVNIFGSIPLKLNPPLTPSDINVAKTGVDTIYKQIETDLNAAKSVLPNITMTYGHATMGAALGMLAKVYLYEGKYTQVISTIQSLDSLNLYALAPVYSYNFQYGSQDSYNEAIIEIHHLRGQIPGLGNYLNQYFQARGVGLYQGYGFDAPTQNFVNEFEITADSVVDPRLDYTIGRAPTKYDTTKWVNGETFQAAWSPGSGMLNRKHVQPFSQVSTALADGELSYIYMRYADILLMKAEALNESGNSAAALVPLNLVRQRARECYANDPNLPGYPNLPAGLLPLVTATDQPTVRTAIRHERRVELGFEFHRHFDLMRYGAQAASEALSTYSNSFNYNTTRYFPIPQYEQDNNTNLNN